jgi:hypothetical protein
MDDTTCYFGFETEAELREALEREAAEREAAAAHAERSQARFNAQLQQVRDVAAGLARFGRGEERSPKPRKRGPGGGRKPSSAAIVTAGVAIQILRDAEMAGERLAINEAIASARTGLGFNEYQAPDSTVADHIRALSARLPDG